MNNEKKNVIAKRYAQALIDIAKSENISYSEISKNLSDVLLIMKPSKEIYEALTNPLIEISNKKDLVETIFGKDVDLTVINFLKLLIDKNRFDLIYDIVKTYNLLMDEINQIARVEVISAIDLDDVEKMKIKEKLTEKLQKEIYIKYEIDKSIIAGLIVKYEDQIADMSLSHKIEAYKTELVR